MRTGTDVFVNGRRTTATTTITKLGWRMADTLLVAIRARRTAAAMVDYTRESRPGKRACPWLMRLRLAVPLSNAMVATMAKATFCKTHPEVAKTKRPIIHPSHGTLGRTALPRSLLNYNLP